MRWLVATAAGILGVVGGGCASPAAPRVEQRGTVAPAAMPSRRPEPSPPAPAVSASARRLPESAFAPLAGLRGAFSVRGVPPATRVSMAGGTTCALTRDGAVWCWLDPGDPGASDTLQVHAWPMPIAGVRGATALDGACWLTDRVHCLRDRDETDPEPDPWVDVLDARSFSVEGSNVCAVRRSGHVACRGNGSFGQLGTPPARPHADVTNLRAATEVSVGRFGACAVEGAGTLVCWGAASLIPWAPGGRGYRAPDVTPPTALRGMRDVTQVSLANGWHCLARKSGRVHCWSPEDAPTILPVNPLPAESEVQGLSDAVGLSGLLVLRKNGALASVDSIFVAQSRSALVARAVGAGVIPPAIAIATEANRACAVTGDGAVICWVDAAD